MRNPDPPSRVREGIPSAIDDVILKAMSKAREGRYDTIDEFANALEAFAASEELARSNPDLLAVRSDSGVRAPESVHSELASAPTLASSSGPNTPTHPDLRDDANAALATDQTPTHPDEPPPEPAVRPAKSSPPDAPGPASLTPSVASAPTPAARDHDAGAPKPLSPLLIVLLVGAITAVVLTAVLSVWRRSHVAGVMSGDPGAVVACPVFEVSGDVPAPGGWLGAAAASLVCERVSDALGGDDARTRIPAELLHLSGTPTDDFPLDPFSAPDARSRSLQSARASPVWLDGRVARDPQGFHLTATAHGPGGRTATARGDGDDLYTAASALTASLQSLKVIPAAAPIAPYARDGEGAAQRSDLIAWHTFFEDQFRGANRAEACAATTRDASRFGPFTPLVKLECQLDRVLPGPIAPVTIDRSSPGRFALTARYHVVSRRPSDPVSLAGELAAVAARTSDPRVRSLVIESEAEMWQSAHQMDRALARALVSVELDPRSADAWARLNSIAIDDPSSGAVVRALSAWQPQIPFAWRWRSVEDPHHPMARAERLRMVERAYILAPHYWPAANVYGRLRIESGSAQAARLLLARARTDGVEPSSLTLLSVALDTSEVRFETALHTALTALTDPALTELGSQQLSLVERALELADILGRREPVADTLAAQFVTPQTHLAQFGPTSLMALAFCAYASPLMQRACLGGLSQAVADRRFLALLPSFDAVRAGVERYVAGDMDGATHAWRPVVRDAYTSTRLLLPAMVDAFDRAGQHDLAEQIDAGRLQDLNAFGGATSAHVRAARRAESVGDHARAQTFAQTVVQAWLTAEGPPASLPAMRAIMQGARTPAAPTGVRTAPRR